MDIRKWIHPPELWRSSNWKDRYETKVSEWIIPWDGKVSLEIGMIGVPLSKSSISVSSASMTPNALRELFPNVTTYNVDHDVDLQELVIRDLGDVKMHVTDIRQCHTNIYHALQTLYQVMPKIFPIIVGGDHSITFPSVQAFRQRYSGSVGIIQLDSHMDVRNLNDGGPTNGTPIRSLLESGTVTGENIVQIGLRSFANSKAYRDYAKTEGIHQYTQRDLNLNGIDALIQKALEIAGKKTEAIYVTVDMDVLDQAFAPGVPAMVPNGMTARELVQAVFLLGQHPKVKGFDIVCVDPLQDPRRATVRLMLHVILHFLTGYYLQKKMKGCS
ncbi:agmatinase family protein [Risungbinella massiliensis]|uniref:agmatinase family protein n=1 Tax=Risungbinella massiliensis TaxID=1329796 RepID=UPI00069A7860|nr:agmatinase family protein [Risungbinella massiliensis]